MDISEPKQTQKTLNIVKMILYELKMCLNEHKRTQKTQNIFRMILYELRMGLNGLKWVSL